jgi:hypothetical protein
MATIILTLVGMIGAMFFGMLSVYCDTNEMSSAYRLATSITAVFVLIMVVGAMLLLGVR